MDIETLREYCIAKKGVSEEFPFDEDTLVFKVLGKMFLLVNLNNPSSFNVKCNPEKAEELREKHPVVQPGYHMSKKHWNTVYMTGNLSRKMLQHFIDDSYDLVVSGLTKKQRAALLN